MLEAGLIMALLEGIKFIDFTGVQAGPACTQLLVWCSADVLKVERPGVGDVRRPQLRVISLDQVRIQVPNPRLIFHLKFGRPSSGSQDPLISSMWFALDLQPSDARRLTVGLINLIRIDPGRRAVD
jgi:CoA-transferase family III